MLLGALLIAARASAARKLANIYEKLGIEAPVDRYRKQFVFVGVLLFIFGFLVASGLIFQI